MRQLLVGLIACALAPAARAGVIVVANFTPADVTLTLTEPDKAKQSVTLAPAQVAPVTVTGPAVVVLPATPQHLAFNVDPYNAYVILPDAKTGRRLDGVELPGDPPERDTRPELNPVPRDVRKVPVTLFVDDIDPRAEALWQGLLKQRLTDASAVMEAHCGIRFEITGFDVWKSDPQAASVPDLLADFQQKAKAPPGGLAIGYASRKVMDNPKEPAPLGASRPAPATHILMREWAPRTEAERTEALVHYVGRAFGAVPVQDQGSVMRERLGDGLALHGQYKMRFDPLNLLALNIWADEARGGKLLTAADVSPAGRMRLKRVYGALLKAKPGDPSALVYLNEFDRDLAQAPPKKDGPPDLKKNADPPAPRTDTARDVIARAVVAGVTTKARTTAGPGGLTGDDLTAAYIRTAAAAALAADVDGATSDDRVGGFLLGLAVALDDTDALRADETVRAVVAGIEPASARDERREVLGNPTIRGRRDLCRRFAAGVGTGELLPRQSAESAAVGRTFAAAAARPAGVGWPGLAADLAGLEFARQPRDDLSRLSSLASSASTTALVPDVSGLADGFSPERFAARYGSATDPRFLAALDDLRRRVRPPAKP
ncbi:MAG TPA: hypothetical protein VH092_27695 [Urbifossiella sp.]|jgi:hypothetical protein|nr:hypothetical protein [Urbifossiella sp.]